MRALMIAAVLLSVPVAAQAAPPKLIEDYMAVCVPTQNNPDGAIAAAKARGFTQVDVAKPDGVDTIVGLAKTVEGQTSAVVIATLSTAAQPGVPAQKMSTCSVTGIDIGTTSADAARRWAGMPAGNMGEAKTEYFFFERAGKRTGIAANDEAGTLAALNSGGYALLQIAQSEGRTALTLTNSKLPK